MHLGLIGGIGPAATEYYYRGLVRAHSEAARRLELTIVHADTLEMLENLAADARQKQAEIFLGFVKRLQSAGADAAVITSLAGHFCVKELEAISPLPIINLIPILDQYFATRKIARIGLLGTRTVMESRFYGGVTSVDFVLPTGGDLDATHENYIAVAKAGQATDAHRLFFREVGIRLCRDQGADAVALAGTDLFLVFEGEDFGFPVIDCAQVHIDALAALSME